MPYLSLFLLGTPRIEREGVPIEVDTRKAIALAAYLAVSGESQSRETVANLLWPDYDQRHAHAALRRTLSSLNKALAGAGLRIDREAVALETAGVWVDVAEFRGRLAQCLTHGHPAGDMCAECVPPLGEAIALYRDDFLAGFTLRDSPNFDEWQFFQSESLRRELASALERLVRWHSAQAHLETAIGYARRWLALDSLHEPAHRVLMLLYARSDQRAAALRQYRECARVLDQELGVAPLDETNQLYELIKENRIPLEAPATIATGASAAEAAPAIGPAVREAGPESLPPPSAGFPLVGRQAEWTALLEGYQAIRADGRFIALEGEAGIGKTRLSEAFVEQARAQGAAVVIARCYEGEGNLAYGPFLEGLRAALQAASSTQPDWIKAMPAQSLAEAARLLPELLTLRDDAPPAPALDGPGAQNRFFEGISQLLMSLPAPVEASGNGHARPANGAAPSVLFLDDLHWADEASLDLLNYLVRRLRGRSLCILGAWRGEQVPANHRLRRILAEAGRQNLAGLISLPRLSRSAVTELVQSAVPAQPRGLTERLYAESEGLPFFVVEYLSMLAARRSPEAGQTAAEEWNLPGGVRDLLESRLALASETGRQLLSAAAAIGRAFDFEILQEASGRGEEETVTGLESLLGQGLVREIRTEEAAPPRSAAEIQSQTDAGLGLRPEGAGQVTFDFSHEKLRTLVYEETSLARRRLLHQRIGQALEQRARLRRQTGPLAGQIAEHYRLAGREAEAARLFKLAGEHAHGLLANAEALSHYRSALALASRAVEDEAEIAGLHEAIGDLLTLAGDYGAALAAYETAAALQTAEAPAAALEHKVGSVHDRRGQWDSAESHYQAARQALDRQASHELDSERARLYADWSLTAHHKGQTQRAFELAQKALELAEAAGDQRALAQAHNILGVLAGSQNDVGRARQQLERSLELAEALGDPGARVAALNNLALAYRRSGDLPQALALTGQALALCTSQGDRHREAALHNNLADLLHELRRSEEAMVHLKQAVAIFSEIGAGAAAGEWQPEVWKLTEW